MDDETNELLGIQFREIMKKQMPNLVVSNFVMIAEVVSEDGAELTIATSDSMTPWLANGMLNFGLTMMNSGQIEIGMTDPDEEDE